MQLFSSSIMTTGTRIWVNKVGGDDNSKFSVKVGKRVVDVDTLKQAILESALRNNNPQQYGRGVVHVFTEPA